MLYQQFKLYQPFMLYQQQKLYRYNPHVHQLQII